MTFPPPHPRSPDPAVRMDGGTLWVAYRTPRGDHYAVLAFRGARPPAEDPAATRPPERIWAIPFPDEPLIVSARSADVVVRAVQARDAESALAMVLT